MEPLFPTVRGPYVRHEPDAVLPAPLPDNRFDCIPPEKLFAARVTPECYLCCRSLRDRELVQGVMRHHTALTLAEALEALWWAGV